ncbi:MAG: hypothetical protein AB1567_08840 [bacterium]
MEILKKQMTFKELKNMESSLAKIILQELPFKLSYRLSKLAKSVKQNLDDLSELLIPLGKKYGDITEQGSYEIRKDPENLEKYFADLNEILNIEVEITYIPISLQEMENLKLTSLDLANLDWLIEEDDDKCSDISKPTVQGT